MKTASGYYGEFISVAPSYKDIAAMDLDQLASDLTEEIGNAYAKGDYHRYDDGMVAVYVIAEMIQDHATGSID